MSAGRAIGTHKGEFATSHRGVQTRMYRKWQSMKARCRNPSHPAFSYYAGRGITICPQWLGPGGFDQFCRDMGECPAGLTLDRIDNTKGYEPLNCRWATWKQQAANRRRGGPARDPSSLAGQARAAGLPYNVVYMRVKRLGWTEHDALSTPMIRRQA